MLFTFLKTESEVLKIGTVEKMNSIWSIEIGGVELLGVVKKKY